MNVYFVWFGPLGSGPTDPGSGFSVMPFDLLFVQTPINIFFSRDQLLSH